MKTDAAPIPEIFTGDTYQPELAPGTVVARREEILPAVLGPGGIEVLPPRRIVIEGIVMSDHYVGQFMQYKPNAE